MKAKICQEKFLLPIKYNIIIPNFQPTIFILLSLQIFPAQSIKEIWIKTEVNSRRYIEMKDN